MCTNQLFAILSVSLMLPIDHHIYSIKELTYVMTRRSNDYLNVPKSYSTRFPTIPLFSDVVEHRYRCRLKTHACFEISNFYVLLCINGRGKMVEGAGR